MQTSATNPGYSPIRALLLQVQRDPGEQKQVAITTDKRGRNEHLSGKRDVAARYPLSAKVNDAYS